MKGRGLTSRSTAFFRPALPEEWITAPAETPQPDTSLGGLAGSGGLLERSPRPAIPLLLRSDTIEISAAGTASAGM